ncbi:MAG: DUF1318 domain-containing protein [Myxococcaceae bacterium]|nr:DUF1318 domain-containing protein [Myxococcaceae bacterium]
MLPAPVRWLPLFFVAACITAPEIVMVDRATALEEQASGSFDELEQRLYRAGMTPAPVPLTPNQLETLGVKPQPLAENLDATPADRLDDLLRRHCVGEALDGLLTETKECRRGLKPEDQVIVDRANKARQALWRWMKERQPQAPEDALRDAWRKKHLDGVVCGGWVQADDGTWGDKKC